MSYTAVIGDIKDSKNIEKRSQVQKKLAGVLKGINELYLRRSLSQDMTGLRRMKSLPNIICSEP